MRDMADFDTQSMAGNDLGGLVAGGSTMDTIDPKEFRPEKTAPVRSDPPGAVTAASCSSKGPATGSNTTRTPFPAVKDIPLSTKSSSSVTIT